MKTKRAETAPARRGPKNVFRGKIKMAFAITLTPDGRDLMQVGAKAAGMSRGDFIDMLLREAKGRDFASMAKRHRAEQKAAPSAWRANPDLASVN